jgi:pimeloyl-ACP methyl ester carboxylesterase
MMASDDRLTLVLVHGAGSSATIWERVVERLGERWPVLAPNLPGHGGEAGPGRGSIQEYATWLEACLASQADGPVVLAGHSMGGAIALETALRRRVELAGLVLISTGARLRVAPETLAGMQTDFAGTMKRMAEYAYAPDTPYAVRKESEVRLSQAGAEVVHADFAACDAFDVMDRLERIALPTLVLCGAIDQMTPPKYAQHLAQYIPGARLELIEGGGHMAPAEQPAALALAIAEFLEELSGGDKDDLDHYRV